MKPFDQERLHQAIERARLELLNSENREVTHRIMELLSHIKSGAAGGSAESPNRLIIKAKGRVIFLDMDEIDWVEAAANYVRLNVAKEAYLFARRFRAPRSASTRTSSFASIVQQL